MSWGIVCRQEGCKEYARVRYTWPGRDESCACDLHAAKLSGIAEAMGMHLQLIPLTEDDQRRMGGA